MKNSILQIPIEPLTTSEILEKILKNIKKPRGFFHIVSLNPENLVVSVENEIFREVLIKAQIKIIDGIGVVMAGKTLNVQVGERVSGVDLMYDLLNVANNQSLKVMLIGGGPKIADEVVECQSRNFPRIDFFPLEGIKDINNPEKREEDHIFSIVADFKPRLIFVAFGSPAQEFWLYKNRSKFRGVVCMGVGGSFDYLAGVVPRSPIFLRKVGFEWLSRLFVQPWRWKRQLRLVKFAYLVARERWKKKES